MRKGIEHEHLLKNTTARTGGTLQGANRHTHSAAHYSEHAAVDSRKKAGGARNTIAAAGPDALPARGRVCSASRIQRADLNCLPAEEMVFLDKPNRRPTFLMEVSPRSSLAMYVGLVVLALLGHIGVVGNAEALVNYYQR